MIHRFATVASTQDEVHRLAAAGAPAGTVVVAEDQTGGRGTRGRLWSSGVNGLWLTVLLRPGSPAALEGLSVRVGLALAAALDAPAGQPVLLKWPNDLTVADRKLGGILCEARWNGHRPDWVAVGVGINVANPLPPALGGAAISLAELGATAGKNALEGSVIAAVIAAGQGQGPLSAAELAAYARRDWLAGKAIATPIVGTAAGLAPDGSLVVIGTDGNAVRVSASTGLAALASTPEPR